MIVTGAARGLGRGIARAFLEAGADVLIADIDARRLADTAGELGGLAPMRSKLHRSTSR